MSSTIATCDKAHFLAFDDFIDRKKVVERNKLSAVNVLAKDYLLVAEFADFGAHDFAPIVSGRTSIAIDKGLSIRKSISSTDPWTAKRIVFSFSPPAVRRTPNFVIVPTNFVTVIRKEFLRRS